jgi:hypothetical protein
MPRALQARVLIPASVVLAALSLVVARSPTFDVWAWLVWGREIAHLDLNTNLGPQFKPLPVAVTTLASPFGDAAVPIWMIIARAAGLLAIAAAARLAWRVAGPIAAAIAATSLISIHLFGVYLMPYGMSEPMLVACVFWAVDRHCDGRRSAALLLLVGASLLRVEAWPFLLAYAIVLARRRQARPILLLPLLLFVPIAWFLPEWWGSGDPFRTGSGRAVPGGPSTQTQPGLAVLASTFDGLLAWVWVGALLGIGWAIRVRDRLMLGLTGIGVVWLGIVAVMAEVGVSSGVSRYLIVTQAVACVLCAAGWVATVRLACKWLPSWPVATRLGAASLVALLAVPSALTFERWFHDGARDVRHQEGAFEATAEAVARAGGPSALKGCGRYAWTRDYREPQVAWLLHKHLSDIESFGVPGLPPEKYFGAMVQIVDRPGDPLLPLPFRFLKYREAGRAVSLGVPAVVLATC